MVVVGDLSLQHLSWRLQTKKVGWWWWVTCHWQPLSHSLQTEKVKCNVVCLCMHVCTLWQVCSEQCGNTWGVRKCCYICNMYCVCMCGHYARCVWTSVVRVLLSFQEPLLLLLQWYMCCAFVAVLSQTCCVFRASQRCGHTYWASRRWLSVMKPATPLTPRCWHQVGCVTGCLVWA